MRASVWMVTSSDPFCWGRVEFHGVFSTEQKAKEWVTKTVVRDIENCTQENEPSYWKNGNRIEQEWHKEDFYDIEELVVDVEVAA